MCSKWCTYFCSLMLHTKSYIYFISNGNPNYLVLLPICSTSVVTLIFRESWSWLWVFQVLQEGGPLPGSQTGLLSNTWKWIVQGDTFADKARDFIGKGHPGGGQEGKGTQENCSVTWLAVSGFMVMGLVSRLSLANHSHSESFLVVHALFGQHGCQREGFWEVVGQVVSPFDLSRILPVSGGLLVPCSLSGPPVIKQFMQMVTMVPGQGGWFQSVCASPNTRTHLVHLGLVFRLEDVHCNLK